MVREGIHSAVESPVLCPAVRMLELLLLISGEPGVGQYLHARKLRHQLAEGFHRRFALQRSQVLTCWRTGSCVVLSCCPCYGTIDWCRRPLVALLTCHAPDPAKLLQMRMHHH